MNESDRILLHRVNDILTYNAETGEFWWKYKTSLRCKMDRPAGHPNGCGYHCLGIDKKKYYAHRIAWLMYHQQAPEGFIDHINGDRSDNRINNLRCVSQTINMQNVKQAFKNGTSGLLGAHKKRDKWEAAIKVFGKRIRLGYFQTPEEAHAAYLEAKRRLHPGCTI